MTMCFNYTKKRLAAVARRSLLGEIWKSRNGGKVFGEDRSLFTLSILPKKMKITLHNIKICKKKS